VSNINIKFVSPFMCMSSHYFEFVYRIHSSTVLLHKFKHLYSNLLQSGYLCCKIELQRCYKTGSCTKFSSVAMRIFVYTALLCDRLVSFCFWDKLFFIEDGYEETIHTLVYISW
jgi:hypothetical protein